MFHVFLHFLVPALIAGIFFRQQWKSAYLLLIATMLVDIDHLLANPVYDPSRCSIGFHPLHELWFVGAYLALCFVPRMPRVRLIGIGLSVHMALDSIDCQLTNGVWFY